MTSQDPTPDEKLAAVEEVIARWDKPVWAAPTQVSPSYLLAEIKAALGHPHTQEDP